MNDLPADLIQHRGIWFPAAERHMQTHLDAGQLFEGKGSYQLGKLTEALSFVPSNRRYQALDIGAHVGLLTRPLTEAFAEVIAFEPIEAHRQCWTRNVERGNARLVPVALGNVSGAVTLAEGGGNTGAAHLAAFREEDAGTAHVARLERLDEQPLVRPAVLDFIKLDCEGAEELVLRGGEQTIRFAQPVIMVEQKGTHAERMGLEPMGAVRLLQSWGMEVRREIKGDFIMTWRPDVAAEVL